MSVDEMSFLITKCKRNLGRLIENAKKYQKIQKKLLTNKTECCIIHTVKGHNVGQLVNQKII